MSEKDIIGIYELDELYICHRYRSVVEKNKADKNAMISLLAELNGCTPRRIRECQKKIECADLFIKSLKNTKNLEQKHLHKLYEALGSHQKGDVVL